MRKTLLTLTALAGLVGAGAVGTASAATVGLENVPAASLVQQVQYYGHPYGWRHREWVRHHRWVEFHRWHHHGHFYR